MGRDYARGASAPLGMPSSKGTECLLAVFDRREYESFTCFSHYRASLCRELPDRGETQRVSNSVFYARGISDSFGSS